MSAFEYPVTIIFDNDRDEVTTKVTASNVQTAIFVAIERAELQPGDLIHMVHLGMPKPVEPT